MGKIRVGVFRGGPSSEYDVSLRTGEEAIKALGDSPYEAVDVLVDRTGAWHLHGAPAEPARVAREIDVAFNALHGAYGEDGKIQHEFERHGIRYTGSRIAPSAVAMHKRLSRDLFAREGLRVAPGFALAGLEHWREAVAHAIRTFGFPVVIKPARHGSSVGVSIAHTAHELASGIAEAFRHDSEILLEKYIQGREATCAVLERFRGERAYAFPVIEIVPPARKKFFDRTCKYDGSSQEVCPGRFSEDVRNRIQRAAIIAHDTIGCRHYSRSDFIATPAGDIYILELNTLPGLTAESLFPKAAASIGLTFPSLIQHLISLALKNPVR